MLTHPFDKGDSHHRSVIESWSAIQTRKAGHEFFTVFLCAKEHRLSLPVSQTASSPVNEARKPCSGPECSHGSDAQQATADTGKHASPPAVDRSETSGETTSPHLARPHAVRTAVQQTENLEAGARDRPARHRAALAPGSVPLGVETQVEGKAEARHALGRFAADARDAETPTRAEGPVAIPHAVDQVQLWLEAIATWGQGQGHRKVAGTRMEVRGKGLAETAQGATPLGQGDDLIGNA
jgi:hypothetical protein